MRASGAGVLDAASLVVLALLAFLGFASTFSGWRYLVVAMAGVGVGLLLAVVLRALRQPVLVLAAASLVVFFGGGVPLVLGAVPGLDGLRTLAASAVLGWKELLTTLPPVADDRLLVVPWILGLLCGATGWALTRPGTAYAGAPVAAPTLVLGLVIALGTHEPAARLADGAGFAVVALGWTAIRLRRARTAAGAQPVTRRATRALAGAAALGVAAVAALGVGPWLAGGASRTVLRDYVVPPFDVGAYPSPLVGFRKYTKDANQLWDQELFTVTGLPDGAAVRIALLEDYDGSVWGAGSGDGGYQRVGGAFGPAGTSTVRVTVAPAYAAATDLNPWLPGAGTTGAITFGGPRRGALAESLRVNLAASSGLVTARLAAGDTYTFSTTVHTLAIPDNAQPAGRPALSESAQALLSSKVATWTRGSTGLPAQLKAVAAYLRANGAYSDGGPGEAQYLPGHSMGRLTAFFNGPRPVGDDEQYAAAYALIANYLGLPARVVLGARPGAGGKVRGSDVHAWVEVHLADGQWASVPQTEFMPDVSKKPEAQPPQAAENTDAIVVPPPNAARQATTTTDTSRNDPNVRIVDPPRLPWWQRLWSVVGPYVTWGAPPLLAVLLLAGGIVGWKARRRRRRRSRGPAVTRFAAGWRELVDAARDTGTDLPAGRTRREEARELDLETLAVAADNAVYGPGEPTDEAVAAYWADVETARRRLTRSAGRRGHLQAALSLRSLRPRRTARPTMPGGAT